MRSRHSAPFRPRPALLLGVSVLALACGRGTDRPADSARTAGPPVPAAVPDPATVTYAPALDITLSKFTRQPSGVYVRDDVVGRGAVATSGREVRVRYTGALTDGTVFDSSHVRGQPLAFTLGRGEVIKGWDEGMAGMHVGGTRTLIVPSALGYGPNSPPGIPPNSVLVFRVQLTGLH